MNEAFAPAEHYRDLIENRRRLLSTGQPDWLETAREEGARAFERIGFPDRKLEQWRYSSPDRLLKTPFFAPAAEKPLSDVTKDEITAFGLSADAYRLVFIDGRHVASLSDERRLPPGVRFDGLRNALKANEAFVRRWLGRVGPIDAHAYSALNSALFDDGLCLHIEAGIQLDRPVEVLHLTRTQVQAEVMSLRNLVVLEEGARATLIQRFVGQEKSNYFQNLLAEIALGTEARLDHVILQEESAQAFHLDSLFLRQDARSRYSGTAVALGAAWCRVEPHVRYAGEGAETDLAGFYLTGDGQQTGFHIDVEHGLPRCASRERYKGIVYGRGRAVVDGCIRVAPDAQGSDAHLANANLLLSRDGEVDAKPQLEIFADDVKCSHGATIGQLDPDQVFYLRSRGIDPGEAGRMLCTGFADEIVAGCPVEGLSGQVRKAIRERLALVDFATGNLSGGKREG